MIRLCDTRSSGYVTIEPLGRGGGTAVPLPGTMPLAGLAGLLLMVMCLSACRT